MARDESILQDRQETLDPSEASVSADQLLVREFAQSAAARQAPSSLATQTAREFVPSFGAFVPEDIAQQMAVESGEETGFLGSVQTGLLDSILGYAYTYSDQRPSDPAEEARFEAATRNYAENNGFKNFAGELLGRALGDSPLDLALGFGMGYVGKALTLAGRAARVSPKAMNRIEELSKQAENFFSNPEKAVFSMHNFKRDAVEGLMAGAFSESIQQQLGKSGDPEDIIDAALMDMMASPVLGTFFRASGRMVGKLVESAEEVTGLPKKELAEAIEKSPVYQASPVETGRVDAETFEVGAPAGRGGRVTFDPSNRELPAGDPLLKRADAEMTVQDAMKTIEGDTSLKSAADKFNANKTESNLRTVLERAFPEDARASVSSVIDFMAGRASAARMTLDQYLNTKNINFRSADKISTEFAEFQQTVNAIENATSVDSFIHELGHIYRSDLADNHVRAIEGKYGVTGGNWNRAAEERFAEDFVSWVRQGEGGSKFSRNLRRAFQALSDWFKQTVGVLTGKGLNTERVAPEVADVFESLFDIESGATLRADREARVFAQREAQRTTELFSPEEPNPEWAARAQATQEEAANVVKEAHSEGTGVKAGSWAPKTKLARGAWKAMKAAPLFGVDNFSLLDTLSGFGKTFQDKIVKPMKEALDVSSEIKVRMTNNMKKLNLNDEQLADLSKTTKVKLDGEVRAMTGLDRISLFLSLADGTAKDGTWSESIRSGYGRIVRGASDSIEKTPGITVDGKKLTLTVEEADEILTGTSLLSREEQKIADTIMDTYKENVEFINDAYIDMTGRPLIENGTQFRYAPQRASVGDGAQVFDDLVGFDAILRREGSEDAAKVAGDALNNRSVARLELTDPFELMNNYIRTVPDSVAFARPTQVALTSLDHNLSASQGANRAFIEENYGKKLYQNTISQLRNLIGDKRGIRQSNSPLGTYIVNIANMSKLALNPTTMLKQWGAIGSAKASGVLKKMNVAEVTADSARFLSDKKARDRALAEAAKETPSFAHRQLGGVSFLDDDLLNSQAFARLMLTRENQPSVADLLKLAKDQKISRSSAWAETVSKGLQHLKWADDAIMAALWQAAKKEGGNPGEKFRDLILASQPSYDGLSRSINQLNRDLLSRSLTAFSTEARKVAAMFNTAIYNYANKEKPTAADTKEMMEVVAPLVAQTAYTTAAGTVGAVGMGRLLYALEDEETAAKNEPLREQTAKKIIARFANDAIGTQPVAGALGQYIFNRMTGNPAFGTSVIGFEDFERLVDEMAQADPSGMIKAFGSMFGSSTAGKVIGTQLPGPAED